MLRLMPRSFAGSLSLMLAPILLSAGNVFGAVYYLNGANAYSDAGGTVPVTVPNALTENADFRLTTGAASGTLNKAFTGEKTVTVSGGAFYLACSGYFLRDTSNFNGTNAVITTANIGEVLGNTKVTLTNSTFKHNVYTANDGGIFLSGSSFYLGNTAYTGHPDGNTYGALLMNGSGGINAVSGENYVYLYKDLNAAAPELTHVAFRTTMNAALNVSKDATLHFIGDYTGTLPAAGDSKNIFKRGEGLLSVEKGTVGAVDVAPVSGLAWLPGIFTAEAGTTKLTDGAKWYADTQVKVSNGATIQLDSAALAASAETYTIAGNGYNSQGALNVTASAASGDITMTAASTIQVGTGAIFTPGVFSGAYALTKTGAGTLKMNVVQTGISSLTVNGGTVDVAKQAALAGKAIQVNSGADIKVTAYDGLQNSGLVTINGGTMENIHYTTLSNGLLLKNATVKSTSGKHNNYGSFLLSVGFTYENAANENVRASLVASSGTSNVSSEHGIRIRASQGGVNNSVIYTDSGAVLNMASSVTYSSPASGKAFLEKGGAGTLKLTDGIFGGYASGEFGPVTGAGNILVSAGTLNVSGKASLYGGSSVNVSSGAVLFFDGSSGESNATYNINGTMKVAAVNRVRGNINVTGSGALLDAAVNDTFGMYDLNAAAQRVPLITLKDGGTLTNSVKRTSSNDGTAHMTIVSDLVLDNGKITSYSIGRDAGKYGNYLLNGTFSVKNTSGNTAASSVMDAYLVQIRNKSGNWNVAEGAVFESCSQISSINNNTLPLTIDGGGTFRPIVEKRAIQQVDSTVTEYTQRFQFLSNSNFTLKKATLDLTALGTLIDKTNNTTSDIAPTVNASNWKLFAVTGSNVNNSGSISAAGKFFTNADSAVKLALTVADGKLIGETVFASGFEIKDSKLEILLDDEVNWSENLNLVDNYELFSSAYGDFASLSVLGGGPDFNLQLSAAGNSLQVVVPEPSAWLLLLLGAGLLMNVRGMTRRKNPSL